MSSPDYSALIDELAGAGYAPLDSFDDLTQPRVRATLDHYARRGWDAVRVLSDSIQFARWSDDGAELLNVTPSGSISSQARFSVDRHGLRMFTVAAELRP